MSYAQTCCRTKIKLTLAVTNRKCRRNWFKTTQNGEQNNPLGVAKKGGLETKFAETAGQMTVGHIRSYKFVRLGEARVYLRLFYRERTTVESARFRTFKGNKNWLEKWKVKKIHPTRSLLLSRWEKHLSKTILFKVKYKMRRLSYYLVLRNHGQGSINIFHDAPCLDLPDGIRQEIDLANLALAI